MSYSRKYDWLFSHKFMAMRNVVFLLFIVFAGCSDYSNRIIVKSSVTNDGRMIEWYYYSLTGGSSASYVDIKTADGQNSHILIRQQVCDVNLYGDSLVITANRSFRSTLLHTDIPGIIIVIDSSLFCRPPAGKYRNIP